MLVTVARLSSRAILVLALLSGGAHAAASSSSAARLVVKYRSGFDACVDCLVNKGARIGSDHLDALHRELGVRGARPLFAAARAELVAGTVPTERSRRLRDRFPARASRGASAAVLPDLSNVYVLEVSTDLDIAATARRYASAPEVAWAHPDYEYSLNFVPDDPFFSSSGSWGQSYPDLWGMHVTDAATAWDTSSGSGVVIAVVDSGIELGHPDITGNLWTNAGETPGNGVDDDGNGFIDDVNGWDFVSDDNTPEDTFGHGSHCAGIAGASGDNTVGIVGMAWQSRIMPVRVFGGGSAPASVIAAGIVYAAENGADVISASFGGPATQIMQDAVETARNLGVIVVAAAGNDATDAAAVEPASLPGVIAVSASDSNDDPAVFTNFGDVVSVAAPGVDVLSLQSAGSTLGPVVPGGYMRLSGTSMAAPHVAGLVAVLLAAQPGLTQDEVRWHLELNADQPGVEGWESDPWNPWLGYGRIDAGRVFDPPPATARLRPTRVERHVHAGGTNTLPDLSLSFTTHAPISWSLIASPGILPGMGSGVGPATIPLAVDGSGVTGGQTLTGSVTADAVGIVSSETLIATVYGHDDNRSGAELALEVNTAPHLPDNLNGPPEPFHIRMASNGDRALVVWNRPTSIAGRLIGAIVDELGIIAGPFTISVSKPRHFDVASDGQNFLVVWIENADDIYNVTAFRQIAAARVLADGTVTPNDAQDPIAVDARQYRPYQLAYFPRVAFDGTDYVVAWQRRDIRIPNGRPYKTWVYFRRIAPDGTPSSERRKLALKDARRDRPISSVDLACLPGSCLFTFKQDFTMHFVRLVDERLDYRNRRQMNQITFFTVDDLVAGSDGYLVVVRTSESCLLGGLSCVRQVRGVRVDSAGNPVDADLLPLTQGTLGLTRNFRQPVSAGFDGTDYLVPFGIPNERAGTRLGSPVFLARLAPDGTVREVEQEGGFVTAVDTAGLSAVAAVNGKLLVAWRDHRDAIGDDPTYPAYASVYAQPLSAP